MKIDAGFGNGQFNVDGFHMHYVNRDIHGGGLLIFFCFFDNMDLSSFCIKSTMLKVKINRSWFALVAYTNLASNIPKSQWSLIFDAVTRTSNDVNYFP